jgi:hypothetical protein
MPVHAILECLASIDENYGHLIVVLAMQLRAGIDVHLAPLEVRLALDLRKGLLNFVAKMTPFARIHHHVVHLDVNADVSHAVKCSALRSFLTGLFAGWRTH